MKVSELSGEALDYWVARAEGVDEKFARFVAGAHAYSSLWAHGGPIIEREQIGVGPATRIGGGWAAIIAAANNDNVHTIYADTPLVAAMRAYVTREFGDEVLA
ncbi:phage protein NinX family protein [Burkholderia anthina]|uniref:phage protein NinX family protein n=1 Tax=Burkholderia anthina TaxID=179879 RepID=UPI001AA04E99|nr:phage protein NinX family protein [Burkholderia anthina]QTD88808.1 DUF2591 family protein [Burkholderia anthina]